MRTYSQQKAALTRAQKKDAYALVAECRKTVQEWEASHVWPDDWSRWQRALDDAFPYGASPNLDDFVGTFPFADGAK